MARNILIVVLALYALPALSQIPSSGLLSFYAMTGSAADSSGNHRDGIPAALINAPDRFANPAHAFAFTSDSSAITLPPSSLSISASTECSISFWVKPGPVPAWPDIGGLISQFKLGSIPTSSFLLGIQDSGSSVRLRLTGDGHSWISFPLPFNPTDAWIHIAAIVRGPSHTVTLSVDGNLLGSGTVELNPSAGTLPVSVGNSAGNGITPMFRGTLDEIRTYDHALSADELISLYGNFRPQVRSILDIPGDQGEKVRVVWDRMYLDAPGALPRVRSYGVWRRLIPRSAAGVVAPGSRATQADTTVPEFDYLGSIIALGTAEYSFVTSAPIDSAIGSEGDALYVVSAHTDDPAVLFFSDPFSGRSVDNTPPAPITSLRGSINPNLSVTLQWDANTSDPDYGRADIFRSVDYGFLPQPPQLIGSATGTTFTDASCRAGYRYYYTAVAVDIHGNASSTSNQVQAWLYAVNSVALHAGWNIVSIPSAMVGATRAALYPSASSTLFTYEQSQYVSRDTLARGRGYWVKLTRPDTVTFPGALLGQDTIGIRPGWNMIGGFAIPVALTDLQSTPAGLAVSRLFSYETGRYTISDTLQPGLGYWVKSAGHGTLSLLSPGGTAGKTVVVQVGDEHPPESPGSAAGISSLPSPEFSLGRNYPNPFNPSTTFDYHLARAGVVRIEITNELGEIVARLVDGRQPAGDHRVAWQAGSFPTGVYFCRMIFNGGRGEVRRIALLR